MLRGSVLGPVIEGHGIGGARPEKHVGQQGNHQFLWHWGSRHVGDNASSSQIEEA